MAPIELVSGLPPDRRSSFTRQLELLARAFAERGLAARIVGPRHREASAHPGLEARGAEPHPRAGVGGADAPLARILLGYPGQFSDLDLPEAGRSFLWCQISRPPRPQELRFFDRVEPVALTSRTREFLAEGMAAAGLIAARPIPIIPHGADTRLYRPVPASTLQGELGLAEAFVVGAVGANTYRKRFDRIFESFALFRRRIEGEGAALRLVVKCDRIVALDGRDLRALASRCGISDSTLLLEGEWAESRMAELYRLFDLFVNLSEWEGFGIPIIEAMAAGVPVVTHEVQGPGEILPYRELLSRAGARSTEEGVLLIDADPTDVARLLEHAYRDPKLRRRLAREGRAAAVERYDIQIIAAKWADLIESSQRSGPIAPGGGQPAAGG